MALAVVEVEDQVVFGDEVARVEAEETGGLVDGVVWAFELDESADGSFVEVDEEILGPFVAGGKFVGGAEFLVLEPAAETETFEDFFEGVGVGEDGLEFFADFVAAIGWGDGWDYGELFGRRFECEKVADGGVLWRKTSSLLWPRREIRCGCGGAGRAWRGRRRECRRAG